VPRPDCGRWDVEPHPAMPGAGAVVRLSSMRAISACGAGPLIPQPCLPTIGASFPGGHMPHIVVKLWPGPSEKQDRLYKKPGYAPF
jgi:hypothetical protein